MKSKVFFSQELLKFVTMRMIFWLHDIWCPKISVIYSGSVAQWITRLTTNQEIAGSTPARVEKFCFDLFFDNYIIQNINLITSSLVFKSQRFWHFWDIHNVKLRFNEASLCKHSDWRECIFATSFLFTINFYNQYATQFAIGS